MPPIRTGDLALQQYRMSLMSKKGAQDRSSRHEEGNSYSRASSASPKPIKARLGDKSTSRSNASARRADVFFQDLSDSELHRVFQPKFMKTNICDQCDKRNKSVMQRCTRCNIHFCRPCTQTVDDGKHRFDETVLDWTPLGAVQRVRVPRPSIYKRRANKKLRSLVAGSRDRVEKKSRKDKSSLPAVMTTHLKFSLIDRAIEDLLDGMNTTVKVEAPKSQGEFFFIEDESFEPEGHNDIENSLEIGLCQPQNSPSPISADHNFPLSVRTLTLPTASPVNMVLKRLTNPTDQGFSPTLYTAPPSTASSLDIVPIGPITPAQGPQRQSPLNTSIDSPLLAFATMPLQTSPHNQIENPQQKTKSAEEAEIVAAAEALLEMASSGSMFLLD